MAAAVINQPVMVQTVNQTYTGLGGPVNAASSSVILKITTPAGTTVTIPNASLTNPATGIYWYAYTPTAVGLYLFRWESPSGADEKFLEVVSGADTI